MSYLGIFGPEFKNSIVIMEICAFEFAYLQIFGARVKYLNLGPQMPYVDIFAPAF